LRRNLDRLRFDVFDAGDIEKMVLVVIDEKAFHLSRVHPAIGTGLTGDRWARPGQIELDGCRPEEAEQGFGVGGGGRLVLLQFSAGERVLSV
jgi:hypothetical protein